MITNIVPNISKKFRALVLTALAALGSVGAVAATEVSPASAASGITFCFTYQNPPNFTAYANKPVFLWEQLPHGEWRLARQGTTNAYGCGTFYNTNPTVQLAFRAYTSTAYQTWNSAWFYPAVGNGTANYGNQGVFRTR